MHYKNKENTMKNILIITLTLLAFLGCSSNNEKSDAYGNFESNETIISSEVSGKIIEINFDKSDLVSENDTLAIIDPTQLKLKRESVAVQKEILETNFVSIDTQIDVIKEEKENLLREERRAEKLLENDAIPQKQLDDLNGKIEVINKKIENVKSQKLVLKKQIKAQNIQIKTIEDLISKCYIKSPINGTVLDSFNKKGEITAAGKPLFKIADLQTLKLTAYVSGTQLTEFHLGQKVTVLVDASATDLREYSGKITFVSNQAEFTPKVVQTREQRTSLVYKIEVEVENDGSLKIGMPAEVNWEK